MNDTNNLISSKQLMAFIISAQIGFGILSLPSDLSHYFGHDGWISLIISGVLVIILILLLMTLFKKFTDKSVFEISTTVFGKILGGIFNIFIILHMIFLTSVGVRFFTEILSLVILKKTPQIITTISILIPSVYMASKGLKVICRYTSLLYLSFISLIIVLLLSNGHLNYTFLLPINQIGFEKLIKYCYISFFSFIGYSLIAIIFDNIRDKENSTKSMILSQIFTIAFFTIITILITSDFGENKLKLLIFPVFSAIQAVHLPIIEHLDVLFILFWFPTMASSFNCFYFCSYHSLMKVFKFKNKKVILCLLYLLILITSRIPKEFSSMTFYIQLTWKFDFIFIGVMLIALLLATFKKKEVIVR